MISSFPESSHFEIQGKSSQGAPSRYFYGRFADFILLGGGSFILLVLARLVFGSKIEQASSVAVALAVIINHPHFAHSYQLFYKGFFSRVLSGRYSLALPAILSGLLVPIGLIVFFGFAFHLNSPAMISLAANIMFLTVGWHYAKQGYGILIADSVLKQSFFSITSKRILLFNCYSTWIFSWLLITSRLSEMSNYFGIVYANPPIHDGALKVSGFLCLASTIIVLLLVSLSAARNGGNFPWVGLSAYVVSLYPWLLWRDPFMIIFYPLLHSTQYLAIVWRTKINQALITKSAIRPSLRLALFAVLGIALGQIGFYTAPQILDGLFPVFSQRFNAAVFMFSFWTFINIHHYFIDSTIWRKENTETMKFLFANGSSTLPHGAITKTNF